MFRVAVLIIALAAVAFGPIDARAQTTIVAVVNGEPITTYAVDQRQRLLRLTGSKGNLREAALNELIDERIQMQAAREAGVAVSDGQVNEAVGNLATRVKLSPSQLRQALGQQGINISTLEDRIRAQIAFNQLIRTRFRTVLEISEPELVAALLKKEEGERAVETPEYDLRQVTIALPESPSDSRLRQARAAAEDLRRRFTSCSQGLDMARGTRNVVVRPFGTRTAAELTPDARAALEDVAVGRLSSPIRTPRGLVMFAVCDKRTIRSTHAAMRELEPDMQNERGQQFSMQYVRQLRRDAVIERR